MIFSILQKNHFRRDYEDPVQKRVESMWSPFQTRESSFSWHVSFRLAYFLSSNIDHRSNEVIKGLHQLLPEHAWCQTQQRNTNSWGQSEPPVGWELWSSSWVKWNWTRCLSLQTFAAEQPLQMFSSLSTDYQ